jgi:hypothetical protein
MSMEAFKAQMHKAAGMGRGGDTMLAHINPDEAAMLKAFGGAGTANPRTGLPEFRPVGDSGRTQGYSNSRDHSARSGGGKASGMSAAAADHLVAMGKIKTPSIPSGGVAQGNYKTQDDAYTDYSKAVGDWGTRNFGNRLADFLGGAFYDENEPMAGNPRSFAGGKFHSSSNPGGIAAGLLSPYGSGLISGPLASNLYQNAGLPSVWHGGLTQPDVRTGPFGNAPAGTEMGATDSQVAAGMQGNNNSPAPGMAGSGGGNTGNGGNQMAAFGGPAAQAPGGAPFGAQPGTPPGMPAFPAQPGLPNHTLPQGYESLFPNSLTAEDKALLYGKALMG